MTARPLLVLVHGTRFDARQWRGYGALVPDAEVVTVDLPGHGSRTGESWSSAAALAVVANAVATSSSGPAVAGTPSGESAPGRPVVLAGHSLGGYVAAAYAQACPDRLGALVLIGATADPSRHPRLTYLYTGFARLLPVVGVDRMAAGANAVLRRLGLAVEDLPDNAGYAVTPQAWAGVVAEARADALSDVACPVYLVAGQYDQLRIDLRAYAAACRRPRIRLIPRASHLAPLTHREEVARVLREAVAEAVAEGRGAPAGPGGESAPERTGHERPAPERPAPERPAPERPAPDQGRSCQGTGGASYG